MSFTTTTTTASGLRPCGPELLGKLHVIQKEVSKLVQDARGYGYNYTSGDTVLGAIRPLMDKLGVLLVQEITQGSVLGEDGRGEKKDQFFTEVDIVFTWIDAETAQALPVSWYGQGFNAGERGVGSALTYAERYFLMKFFHVSTDKDDPNLKKYSTDECKERGAPPARRGGRSYRR